MRSFLKAVAILSLCIQGCAAATKDAKTEAPKNEIVKIELKEKSEFQKGVQWNEISEAKNGKCVVPTAKVDWKKLVDMAGICTADKSWLSVEKLASILLEQETDSAWGPYFMSLVAESRSHWARSFWMIDTAIKRSPKTGAFVFHKARLLWKNEAPREALAFARQAVELDPNLISASEFVAQILYRDHDYAGSLKELQRAASHGLRGAATWAMMAECSVQTGNNQAAIDYFEKAVSLEPKKVDHRLRQAYVFDELLQNKSEALTRYLQVQDLIKKGGYAGQLSFNLSEKIEGLKKLTANAKAPTPVREPSNKLDEKSSTAGGKK